MEKAKPEEEVELVGGVGCDDDGDDGDLLTSTSGLVSRMDRLE